MLSNSKIRAYSIIFIAGILLVCLVVYRHGMSIYNADQVIFASMIVDIRNGFSLRDWEWPANNHFVPELLFYLILNFLRFLSPTFIHQLFILFSSILFLLAFYWIGWWIFDFKLESKGIWLSSIVLFLALFVSFANRLTYFLALIFQPALHGIIYSSSLLCLLLCFKIQENAEKTKDKFLNIWEIILLISVFLLSLSESFFVLWFTIPICCTLFILKKTKEISPANSTRQIKLIFYTSISGYIIHKIISQNTSSRDVIALKRITRSFANFAEVVVNNPGDTVYGIIALFGSIFCVFWVMKNSAKIFLPSKMFWLWNLCSIGISFLVVFVYGLFMDRGSIRYLQPLIYANLFLIFNLLILAIASFNPRQKTTILHSIEFITIALGVLTLILLPSYFNSHKASAEYKLYQCLTEDNVRVLYSGFWKSKPTYMFSEGKIIPRQIRDRDFGDRLNHSNNPNWYTFKPEGDYKVAILDDTGFGRQNFPDAEAKSCHDFNYQLLSKEREDYFIEQVQ